ncbi:MAG: amidohydrolase family protein [Candidatus Methanomethylophilaceae archaeon]|nr:amidohydrolase family protein [Candidatus Methanomethylophilaceae archaeon]
MMRYISGQILLGDEFVTGHIGIEDGIIKEIGDGDSPAPPLHQGIVLPSFINGHTHCADGAAPIPLDIGLEEAVAPPHGLKHRFLGGCSEDSLRSSMTSFMEESARHGSSAFVDFREGGLLGVKTLQGLPLIQRRVVLGRPVSPRYDHQEVDSLLDACEGLGLSCISDMDAGYLDSLADHVHRRGKILALHASENRREDIELVMSLEPDFLVHMVEASDDDLRRCADQGLPVVICPRSNLFFGKVTPVRRMRECGVETALGTDNAMVCNPDMRTEGEFLLRLLRSQNDDAAGLLDTCVTRIRKILNAESGLPIKLGKEADLVVFPGDGIAPLADLFLRPKGSPVTVRGAVPNRRDLGCRSKKY